MVCCGRLPSHNIKFVFNLCLRYQAMTSKLSPKRVEIVSMEVIAQIPLTMNVTMSPLTVQTLGVLLVKFTVNLNEGLRAFCAITLCFAGR